MRDRTKKIFDLAVSANIMMQDLSDDPEEPFIDSGSEYVPTESGRYIFYIIIFVKIIAVD